MFLLNFFLLTAGSSGAVPFGKHAVLEPRNLTICSLRTAGTMALIVLLWFGISAPLSAVGSYFGSKHGV